MKTNSNIIALLIEYNEIKNASIPKSYIDHKTHEIFSKDFNKKLIANTQNEIKTLFNNL